MLCKLSFRLLTDSPEKMWSAVEQSDFLLAAQVSFYTHYQKLCHIKLWHIVFLETKI